MRYSSHSKPGGKQWTGWLWKATRNVADQKAIASIVDTLNKSDYRIHLSGGISSNQRQRGIVCGSGWKKMSWHHCTLLQHEKLNPVFIYVRD